MEEYVEQYKKELEKYMATTDGTYTGTMVITRVQPEEEIAEIKFVVPNTDLDTVLFRGRWKDSALYLDAVEGVAGGAWTLHFKKKARRLHARGAVHMKALRLRIRFRSPVPNKTDKGEVRL